MCLMGMSANVFRVFSNHEILGLNYYFDYALN